ncbi:hypothetical protein BCF44_10155 [Kutzneria buriramensis]|uniref:Uncharacterized protein n=1 Tax=Kutzneria buriramensis TaxID=1045776 RepID=A0A3E0I8T4_9PSEU|nr:hypothetical protein BCF44_10155 [Kutzneria buriramensis]
MTRLFSGMAVRAEEAGHLASTAPPGTGGIGTAEA